LRSRRRFRVQLASPTPAGIGGGIRNRSALSLMQRTGESREHPGMHSNSRIVDLADRHSNDLDVVLLWGRGTGRLWVNVTHRRSGRTARIDATPTNALVVFHHPFAYGPPSPQPTPEREGEQDD
jgi:hypothetical protein